MRQTMHRVLTDSPILLRMAYSGLCKLEIPVEQVFAKAGLSPQDIDNSKRTPTSAQHGFWQALIDITQDEHIGLHLGESLPLYRGHVIEYLFTSSSTFGQGLERALAYQRLVSDGLRVKLVKTDAECYLVNDHLNKGDLLTLRHFTECLLVAVIRFFRFITEGQFQPLYLCLNLEKGADLDEYREIYGCEVSLQEEQTRLYFDPEVLDMPMWQAEPELLRLHERLAADKLMQLARFDLINRVRQLIGENLESGEVSLSFISGLIGMPQRQLRTQLSEADTSFHQILSSYRERLAKNLLADTQESIERIVYLTGFSEPSTFYRAFKRWTQETPIHYRQRKMTSQ